MCVVLCVLSVYVCTFSVCALCITITPVVCTLLDFVIELQAWLKNKKQLVNNKYKSNSTILPLIFISFGKGRMGGNGGKIGSREWLV